MPQSSTRPLWGALLLLLSTLAMPGMAQDDEVTAPPQLEDPREILESYPAFETPPRIPTLEDQGYYPCSDCHDNEFQLPNPTVRELVELHDDIKLVHGKGRFWCLTCHHETKRDYLTSFKGQTISFDEPYLLCGQCHFQRQRDFFYGAHGKRIGGWKGERTVTSCTECHDPHQPAIKPAQPFPPPKVRTGLEPPGPKEHEAGKPWEKAAESREEAPSEDSHGGDG